MDACAGGCARSASCSSVGLDCAQPIFPSHQLVRLRACNGVTYPVKMQHAASAAGALRVVRLLGTAARGYRTFALHNERLSRRSEWPSARPGRHPVPKYTLALQVWNSPHTAPTEMVVFVKWVVHLVFSRVVAPCTCHSPLVSARSSPSRVAQAVCKPGRSVGPPRKPKSALTALVTLTKLLGHASGTTVHAGEPRAGESVAGLA